MWVGSLHGIEPNASIENIQELLQQARRQSKKPLPNRKSINKTTLTQNWNASTLEEIGPKPSRPHSATNGHAGRTLQERHNVCPLSIVGGWASARRWSSSAASVRPVTARRHGHFEEEVRQDIADKASLALMLLQAAFSLSPFFSRGAQVPRQRVQRQRVRPRSRGYAGPCLAQAAKHAGNHKR